MIADDGSDDNRADVILFKASGKYYTSEPWRIPAGAIGPWDMIRSPDFRRIDGGPVLIETQEPWGYPHLFPASEHAGVDGSCPDYGSKLDPCPPGCASGTCVVGLKRDIDQMTSENTDDQMTLGMPNPCQPIGCDNDIHLAGCVYELVWVLRTWADVIAGDTVRAPGSDVTADIFTAARLNWHVDPRTGTSSFNPPIPLDHAVVRVRFEHERDGAPRDMNPAAPVEIQLTRSELRGCDLFGWENRVSIFDKGQES